MKYAVTYVIEAEDDDDAHEQADEAYDSFHSIYEGPIVVPTTI